jgi:predicted Fe-Mo cluster-binding NifX family protein
MKVAITSLGTDLHALVDPHFGRAKNFIILDLDTMEYKSISNGSMEAAHGAGIQSGQLMSSEDVSVVITGQVGPNAYQTLTAGKIKVYQSANITVEQAIESFKKGELKQILQSGPEHGGMKK